MGLGCERRDALTRGLVHHVGFVEGDDDGDVPHPFDVGKHLVDRIGPAADEVAVRSDHDFGIGVCEAGTEEVLMRND